MIFPIKRTLILLINSDEDHELPDDEQHWLKPV
jgi:hypothetical protein